MAFTIYQAAVLAQFVSMCVCTAFLVIMLRQKSSNMSVLMLMTCVAAMVQNGGYMLELTAQDVGQAITAVRAEYLGGAFTASLMFLFICQFCGVKIPKIGIYLLVIFDIAVHFSVWSCDWNFLYYTSMAFDAEAVIPHIVLGKGPLYLVNMSLILAQLVFSAFLAIRNCFRVDREKIKGAVCVVMSVAVPAILFFISMTCDLGGYDVVPVSEALGVLFLVIATVRQHVFDVVGSAYDNIIRTMDEAVIVTDSNFGFMEANNQARRLFPDISGYGKNRQMPEGLLKRLIRQAEDQEIIYQNRTYRVHRNRIEERDRVEGYALIFFDVTEERRQMENIKRLKEDADKANSAKSDFLARMSHEIRTPINAVIGMNEMILRESREPEIRKYAFDSKSAAAMLLNIINNILDFSKIESGKMEIVELEYGFSSMLNNIYNLISVRAAEKGLGLEFDISENIPSVLYGDDIRIRQVIINLLTNAVKYTPQGKVTLAVESRPDETEEDVVRLMVRVKDTGIGIKEEDMEKLFEVFERADMERNRNIEGTGLGMNICVKLLELMGSTLQVESVYGSGSTFSFELRQRVVDAEPMGDFKERLEEAVSSYSYSAAFKAPEARVLVVDDSEINCRVFVNLLKETEMQIDTRSSGKECLEAVKSKRYDLIFLDHMMPDMDGIETLHAMKSMEENLCRETPVIMLTANAVTGAKEEYLKEGFDAFLTKPIISAKMEELIARMLPQELVHRELVYEKNTAAGSRTYHTEEESAAGSGTEHAEEESAAEALMPGTDQMPVIEGFDWNQAMRYFPDRAVLRETALDFADSVEKELGLLKERSEQIGEEDILNLYRIQVHALKSTLAMLGAAEFSEMAKKLETAAKEQDLETIREQNPKLEEILKLCRDRLSALKEEETEKEEAETALVLPLFYMIGECLKERNYDSADALMKKIREFRYETDLQKDVDLLYSQVENLEADAGKNTAEKIVNKLKEGVL